MTVRSAPRLLGKSEFAAWNLDRERNEVLGAVQLKVVHLHGDGQFGNRVAQHQRIFELPFFVSRVELAELLCPRNIPVGNRESAAISFFSVILSLRNLPSSVGFVV